jgi:hypothetical protein
MASPESKDETTVLDTFWVAEPVSHDGSSDRSSSRLEESKEEVDEEDKGVSEQF